MSVFAGIVFFDARPVDTRTRDRVANAIPRQQGSTVSVQCVANAVFAQRIPLPDGRARLVGAFAFAYWDCDAGELLLGRDCLGHMPLVFHVGRGFAAFASTYNGLFALPDVPRQIDEVMLGHFLALNLRNRLRTLYRGIERVPSRSVVAINGSGYAHREYWAPNPDAALLCRTEDDYIARGRELLDQAVASAMGGDRAALMMSGGLDSSGVAATAARLGLGDRLDCYTTVAPGDTQVD